MNEAAVREREIIAEIDEVPVWRYGHVVTVENHLIGADYILRTVVDVAKQMHQEALECVYPEDQVDRVAVQDRMDAIVEMVEQYRQRQHEFVETIYKKRKAGEGA